MAEENAVLMINRVIFDFEKKRKNILIEIQKRAQRRKKTRRAANYCTLIKMTNRARFSCFVNMLLSLCVCGRFATSKTFYCAIIGDFYVWHSFFQNDIKSNECTKDTFFINCVSNLCNFLRHNCLLPIWSTF